MRGLILMEDRPDGTVEIVTATADGATEITTERGPATGYVLHDVERAAGDGLLQDQRARRHR
jgi:hypothetical protein